MNNNIKNIAELLPEGLSESTINEIAVLVEEVIVDQVQEQIEDLETKVFGYLRLKIDDLKEHAIEELSQESEVYRHAQLFEQVKSLMSIELTEEDDETALASLMKESHDISEERDLVIDEYNKSLYENENLENTVKALSDKISALENDNVKLVEEVEYLQESKDKPFKSSEQAHVISNDVDSPQERTHNNEFLTEEVMKFMPFNS